MWLLCGYCVATVWLLCGYCVVTASLRKGMVQAKLGTTAATAYTTLGQSMRLSSCLRARVCGRVRSSHEKYTQCWTCMLPSHPVAHAHNQTEQRHVYTDGQTDRQTCTG